MKARSAARELALMALYQANPADKSVTWEKSSLQELVLNAVRSLSTLAQDNIQTVGEEIELLQNYMVDVELDHPDNEEVPLEEPTKPVAIPTNREMAEKLGTILMGLQQLQTALELPELMHFAQREDVQNYTWMLIKAVHYNLSDIDSAIDTATTDWRLDRLQKMDLSLLRLAVAELRSSEAVDTATVVDEILDLASRYTTEESKKFIHGVLGAISQAQTAV